MAIVFPLFSSSAILQAKEVELLSSPSLGGRAETSSDGFLRKPFFHSKEKTWEQDLYEKIKIENIYWLAKESFIATPPKVPLTLEAVYFCFSPTSDSSLMDDPLGLIRFRPTNRKGFHIELLESPAYTKENETSKRYVEMQGMHLLNLFMEKLQPKKNKGAPTDLETLYRSFANVHQENNVSPCEVAFFDDDKSLKHTYTIILEHSEQEKHHLLQFWLKLSTLNEENQVVRKQIIQLPDGKEECKHEDSTQLVSSGITEPFKAKSWKIYHELLKIYADEKGSPLPNTPTTNPESLQKILESFKKKDIHFIKPR